MLYVACKSWTLENSHWKMIVTQMKGLLFLIDNKWEEKEKIIGVRKVGACFNFSRLSSLRFCG